MIRDYVLYHAHCPDGFGAAWAAWKRLGDTATYVPVSHDGTLPEIAGCDRLFLLDFAYPRPQLDRLRAAVPHVTILDHHKSARAALEHIRDEPPRFAPDRTPPGVFARFDMNESGATLSWAYFHPGTACPELLRYIRDRDLWRHALAGSRAVNAAIRSYPHDFGLWSEKLAAPDAVRQLRADGEALLRKQAQDVAQLAGAVMWMDLSGYRVPVVNATDHISDIGNRLCELFPEAAFSASYRDTADDRREWSLRSVGTFDVSLVAKRYGGGGHRNASGFRTGRPPLLVSETD